MPEDIDQLLTIKETELFTAKTNLHFLQHWLKFYGEKSKSGDIYLNLLENIENLELAEVQNLLDSESISINKSKELKKKYSSHTKKDSYNQSIDVQSKGILIDFKKRILRNCEFYLWNKQQQKYISEIDWFELTDNPAPACGNSKCYYEYAGENIYSYRAKFY